MGWRLFWKLVLTIALCALIAIAADADGRWRGEIRLTVPRVQVRGFTMDLKTDASGRVSGTIADENGNKFEILDGQTEHDEIWFGVPTGASDVPRFEFRGRSTADTLSFSISGIDPRTSTLIKLGEATARRQQ